MALATPHEVIRRAGITAHPEYEDTSTMDDCAGFYSFRPYPADTPLAQIVTADGRPAVRCYLRFVVLPPAERSSLSRIAVEVWFQRRWRRGRGRIISTEPDPYKPEPGDPDAPTPQSAGLLAKERKPIDLDPDDVGEFLYDHREDTFLDENGRVVTPVQILESAYRKHCRTLRLGFRIRWNTGSILRWFARQAVWQGQDAAMWGAPHLLRRGTG